MTRVRPRYTVYAKNPDSGYLKHVYLVLDRAGTTIYNEINRYYYQPLNVGTHNPNSTSFFVLASSIRIQLLLYSTSTVIGTPLSVQLGIRTFDPKSLGIRTCTDTEAIRNLVYSSSVLFFILYGYRGLLKFVLGVPVSVLLSVRILRSTSISVVRIPGPQCSDIAGSFKNDDVMQILLS